jgi:hypothetical protein
MHPVRPPLQFATNLEILMKRKCPNCGSTRTIPIIYGLPTMETAIKAQNGEVEIGGCIVTGDDPQRCCQDCGLRF